MNSTYYNDFSTASLIVLGIILSNAAIGLYIAIYSRHENSGRALWALNFSAIFLAALVTIIETLSSQGAF